MTQGIFLRIVVFALLSTSAFSQDAQARADALLQKAREIEDIRASNASPFLLRAAFSFVGGDFNTVYGTYSETWVSNSKWREETVIGDLREIAVGASGKHWVLFPDGFPARADRLPAILTFIPPASLAVDFASLAKRASGNLSAECAYTQPDRQQFRSVFCFEEQSGVLLQKVFPAARPLNLVFFSCEYGSFRSFQKYLFPREVACFEDQHKAISANVIDLSAAPDLDPALFDRPPGAVEIPECSGQLTPPYLVGARFTSPLNPDSTAHVPVWFLVNTKDRPQNIRVLSRLDKDSQRKAIDAVDALILQHGACDGRPMTMSMSLQVSIERRR
jgi:hypothetical protein